VTSAVVVGGSVAGLLTARVLSDVVDEVVVLERRRPGDHALPRGHVPQGRHLHLLLSAGLDRLLGWFPGVEAELEALGAVSVDGTRAWAYQNGGYRAQGDYGPPLLCMTRPLLESVLRRRVSSLPNVDLKTDTTVDRVVVTDGRVTGIVVDGTVRSADLVVDCSGRSSRVAHRLATSGQLDPPIARVHIDVAYTSGFLPRTPDDLAGSAVVIVASPPDSFRGGVALPVEGDRWMVTLSGVHGDAPGTSPQEVLAFARGLSSPVVAQLLELAGPLDSVATYRFPSSQRRHYEKLRTLLPGLVTLGDAACSFNPVYGQGMACAALQADALGEVVRRVGLRSDELPRRFHRRAARIIDQPWAIAVGGDFLHPLTVGPRPRRANQINRYVARLVRASQTSLPVARTFHRALNLAEPLSSQVRPDIVARVLAEPLRARGRRVSPLRHPRVGPPTAE
jgi:2-polyprenyl-6-methoxyphenol hydroxylase-like FAD-dependent oxidoreductase